MPTLKELRKEHAELIDQATALSKSEDFDAEAFDALMADADIVEANIDRLEKLEKRTKSLDSGQRKTSATASTPRNEPADNPGRHVYGGAPAIESDPMFGFADMGEFGQSVAQACRRSGGSVDDRLQALQDFELNAAPSSVHVEQGSDNGYMVPPQVREDIMNLVMGDEVTPLNLASPEPTSSNEVKQSTDETTAWGATGIQSYWASENVQFTPSSLETKQVAVPLHKLYAFVNASEELLEDTARLANRLQVQAPRAINYKASEAIVNGTGAGQPLGFAAAASLVSVAKEGSQAADTIVAANVAKMWSRLLDKSGAYWLVHQDAMPQIMVMTLGDQPIWTPPVSGFKGAPSGTLLGLPIIESEHCQTVGDLGDIYLWQPKGYGAYQKQGGIKFAQSMHLYFDYDVQAFRWTFRIGGRPYLQTAVSPDNGSSTRSHQIALAART